MKYCSFCGTSMDDTALFCSKCGKKTESPTKPDNQQLLSDLEKCKSAFVTYQQKYDIRNQAQYELIKKPFLNGVWLYVVCLIAGFWISDALDYTFWSMGIQGLGVMGTLIGIGIVLPIIISNKRKERRSENQKKYDEMQSELIGIYESTQLPLPLAFEYSDPRIIGKLMDIVRVGRAENLKEAINCMIDDQHKLEMINAQKSSANNLDTLSLITLGLILKNRK